MNDITQQHNPEQMLTHRIPKRLNVFEGEYNRLAAVITPAFLHISCTPNQVTVISGLFGILGAVLLVYQDRLVLVLAGVCIHIFAVLDLVDGNIARAKNMQSNFGRWLDIFFDKLNDFLLIGGLTFGAYRATGCEHVLILGMGLMGFVFFIQFVMVVNDTLLKTEKKDMYKNITLQEQNKIHTFVFRLIKGVTKTIFQHCTLGHSVFLFLISLFAVLNKLYFGLWFLIIHAGLTLMLIITRTFFRLHQHEKIRIS